MAEMRLRKMPEEMHRQIKIEAAKKGISQEKIIYDVLENYLKKLKNRNDKNA